MNFIRQQVPRCRSLSSAALAALLVLAALTGRLVAQGARAAGPPVRLGFLGQPPITAFGGSVVRPGIQVQLLDSANSRVAIATDSVTLSLLKGPEGGAISGRVTVAAVAGIATFDSVALGLRGSYKLLAVTQALGVKSAESNAVNVVPGRSARLAFRFQPTNVARNGQFLRPLAVWVQDSGGNFVSGVNGWPVTISVGGASGESVAGTLTRLTDRSQAAFNDLKFSALAEGLTLVASTSTPGIMPATSAPFAVREPGPARRLRIFAPVGTQRAGVPPSAGNVIVAALDSSGIWLPAPSAAAVGQISLVMVDNRQRNLRVSPQPPLTSGRWNFWATFLQEGTYRLAAVSTAGLRADTSAVVTVNAGPASRVEVANEPPSVGVETPLTPPIQVRIVDGGGAIVAEAVDTVIAALLARPGTPAVLSGTLSVEASGGVATFDNLKVSAQGQGYRIVFRSKAAYVKDTTAFFNVEKVGAAAKLRLLNVPTSALAGGLLSPPPRVVAVDSAGTVVRTFSEGVTLEITGGPDNASLAGTKESDAAEGVANFTNVWIPRSGTAYRLIAKAPDVASDTSPPFDVNVGPADALRFRTQPREYEYGAEMAGTVEVEVVDAGGNLVSTATDSIVLSADPFYPLHATAVRAVKGVATFSGIKVDGLPPRRLTNLVASAAAQPALTRGVSQPFSSTPGKATKLHVVSTPKFVNQAQKFDDAIRVEVRDANDYPVPGDASEVTIVLGENPGKSTLGGTLRKRAVGGVVTFDDLFLSRLGRGYTLVVSSGTLTADTSAAFTVIGPAYRVAFVEQPSDGLRNGQLSVVVQVQDSLGTPRNAGTTTMALALGSTNARAVLAGTTVLTARAASARANTPTEARISGVRITEEGNGYTLLASAPKLAADRSKPFNLQPHGLPHHLAFESAVPVSTPSGTIAPAVVVSVLDSIDNVVVSSADVISLAIDANPTSATLNGTTTATALSGRATFAGLSLSASGTGYVLRATSGPISAAKSEPFAVVDATAPCKLAFTQQPLRPVAGVPIPVAVSVQRCDGTVVAAAADAVTIEVGRDPTGRRPPLGGSTHVAAVVGVATFTDIQLTSAAAGYTLVARAAGLTPAVSQPFDVSAGPAAKLVVIDPPANLTAGSMMTGTISVWVADGHGNRVPTATAGVTISLSCSVKSTSTTVGPIIVGWQGAFNPPTGTCAAAKGPTVPALQGVATFDLSKYKVRGAAADPRFTFMAGVLTEAQSEVFTIAPGAPYTLGFEGAASTEGRRAKVPFDGIRVSVRDSIGNEVNSGNDVISLTVGQGTMGKLEGARELRADNGVATFNNLSISEGGAGVVLVGSTPGLANGTSAPFAVASYGKPSRLFFKTSPTNVAPDQKMAPIRVEVQDEVGNVVDTARVRITLSIENNPGAAELRGQGPIETRQGVAEFRDVRLNRAGAGYSIRAAAEGLTEITSAPFDIGVPAPAPGKPDAPGKGP